MEFISAQIYIWVAVLQEMYELQYQQAEIWLPF